MNTALFIIFVTLSLAAGAGLALRLWENRKK